jgi:ribosome assembly protein 1
MNTNGNGQMNSRLSSPAGTPMTCSLRVSKALIEPVLAHPKRIRNVCILAHVDHGKTTLTDTLLASNGIISFKQAGRLRYMDSREDEQQRGITMQASAITLLYDAPVTPDRLERHAINLIDSPGHVDFSPQVVTAARLCDGCLVLVDAVEGVCTQTLAVLRQARRERLTPCLVINKIDRLVTELRMSTTDAANWLHRLLEQVNAVQATIKVDDFDEAMVGDCADNVSEESEPQQFDPLKGNVIFASSTDGWACTVEHFVQLYSKKLEMKAEALRQTLWGEFYYDAKAKKVLRKKGAEAAGLTKPMFAQFVLDAIWAVYESTVLTWNEERIDRIAAQTGAKLPTRELKAKDGRSVLRTLMGAWLPLAETIFGVIVTHIPSPLESNRIRLASIIKDKNGALTPAAKFVIERLASPIHPEEEPMVAFVSKFFAVTMQRPSRAASVEDLTEALFALDASPDHATERLIGMARMFHGTLSVGDTIYVLSSTPAQPSHQKVTVTELFLLMGRDLETVNRVHTGSIFGIGGIAHLAGKSATISSTIDCPPLETPRGEVAPIVQVAVRPAQLVHIPEVAAGLELLCQADPCAETFVQEENGEHILATAGELHLEQCLTDLRERYTKANVDLIISPPMVPYRETLTAEKNHNKESWQVHVGFSDTFRDEDGLITLVTMDGKCRIGARAVPLPDSLLTHLSHHRTAIRNAIAGKLDQTGIDKVTTDLKTVLSTCNEPWCRMPISQIWTTGPRREGSNLLISTIRGAAVNADRPFFVPDVELRPFQSSILTGFQVVTEKGPLINEPLMGVAFILETFELTNTLSEGEDRDETQCMNQAQISSQLISLSRTLFEAAFCFWSPRLMLAVYRCAIQTTAEMLGRVYSALGRRHGRIIDEEYHEGTGFFTVNARLPVADSFGFADDLRGRTAGVAIPQLVFAGFETLPEDPFWVPSTEEELEEYGTLGDRQENLAMRHFIKIRERKGLFIERKIVQFAEKQRTLKK